MRKLLVLIALAFFTASGQAFASSQASGYSRTEAQHTSVEHQVVEVYFNNSGGSLTSGTVVILDTSGSGLNGTVVSGDTAGNKTLDVMGDDGDVDNLGTYITTTTTADDERVAGVVRDNSCSDQSYCSVVVRGPIRARCYDSTDAITAGATGAVGTTTAAGLAGAGKGLGFALENGTGNDNTPCMIQVQPGYGT